MLDARRQITRNRISYSCQNCRRRKIKCTKSHPSCDECLKTKDECVYDSKNDLIGLPEDSVHGYILGKRKLVAPHVPDNVKEAPSRQVGSQLDDFNVALSKLEGIVAHFPVSNSEGRKTTEQEDLSKISDRLQRLLESIAPSTQQGIERDAIASEPPVEAQKTQVPTTYLSDRTSSQVANIQYSFIPSQQQSNVLFRNWLLSVYPILPIVDPTEVLIKYEIFHQWYKHGCDKGFPNPVKAFMPMIFAVHYAGTVSMSLKGLRRWWPEMSRRMLLIVSLDHYMRSISSLSSSNRATLAAKVMMWYFCRNIVDDLQTGSHNVAAIIRDAQMLGLHRQPSQRGSVSSRECDRRLWWEIVSLDTNLASSTSMPPMINEHYFDTTFPSEIKDILLGTIEATKYEEALRTGNMKANAADDPRSSACTSVVSIHFMISRLRARLTSSTRELVGMTLGVSKMTKYDLERMQQILNDIEASIKKVIDRVPSTGVPEMNVNLINRPEEASLMDHESIYAEKLTLAEVVCMLGEQPIEEPHLVPYFQQSKLATTAFHKWARIYLSALLDQIYSLSYGPFMRSLKSKMWSVARQCLLKHCHSFTRKYIVLATDSEIQRFGWAWMAMLQPMHSSLLLLLDLYERPDSPVAARSRALIDHMLSLGLEEQGVVGGDDGITSRQPLDECGEEARSLLLDLRTKAWQRAGLDSTVLWTEQDQIQIGAGKRPTDADLLARSMREDTIRETEAGSSASSWDILRSQYRRIVLMVTGEVWHPSELGEPPDVSGNSLFLQRVNEVATDPRVVKLLRARHDQEPVPVHKQEGWLRVPGGHITSLKDIDQLLRKIKDVKSSATGLREAVSKPANNDRLTPSDKTRLDLSQTPAGHGAQLEQQSEKNKNIDIESQPNIGLQQPKSREVELDFEGGQTYNQTIGLQSVHDFDWNHWDSVFTSLNDEKLADMISINEIHGQ